MLGLPSLGSAREVPTNPVLLGSQLYHPSPNLLGSEHRLRCPGGYPPLREVLLVVIRRRGSSSHPGALPFYLQNPQGPELSFCCDRMLGKVGVEELGFVHHVSGMSDVRLQFLVEGEGEVELIQRLPVRSPSPLLAPRWPFFDSLLQECGHGF